LYKVGEDSVSDAFSRAADAVDHAQVVMVFPTLREELDRSTELQRQDKARTAAQEEVARKVKQEEDEREKLKAEWLSLLFTCQSVASMSPEGPIPATAESGNKRAPSQLFVWIGDSPRSENALLQDLGCEATTAVLCLHWSEHASAEGMADLDLKSPEILDGSWYRRTRADLENTDLDLLHDVELLSRSMVAAIDTRLGEYGLDWNKVILGGFGKGAGLALYAAILRIIPKRIPSIILFCPVLLFPSYLAEKMKDVEASPKSSMMKIFTIWGSRDVSTPSTYRQLLTQVLRKAENVHVTPDTLPDGDHVFDVKSQSILTSLIPLCMPR
jgi:predicted esterase